MATQLTDPPTAGVGVQVNHGIVTVSPAIVVITAIGVESLVRYGSVVSPQKDCTTIAGASVSTITTSNGAEYNDSFPAGSVCVAEILCEPSSKYPSGTIVAIPPAHMVSGVRSKPLS